jgi:hypothetical protein
LIDGQGDVILVKDGSIERMPEIGSEAWDQK